MLFTKGDADDGEAQKDTEAQMNQRCPEAAANDPNKVEDRRQATRAAAIALNGSPEREKHDQRQLKTLQAEWNSNDRAA